MHLVAILKFHITLSIDLNIHLMPHASGLGIIPTMQDIGLSVVSGKSGFLKIECTLDVVSPHCSTSGTARKIHKKSSEMDLRLTLATKAPAEASATRDA